jgi:hypothetical protein
MSMRIFTLIYSVKYGVPIAFPVPSVTIGGGGIANGDSV